MPKDEENIDRMLWNYSKLHNVIADYDTQLNQVLAKHEDDFLSAYKTHMMKVEKELLFLKNRATEQEGKLASDDRIVSLEN